MAHVRAHILIEGARQAADFVSKLNSDGTTNKFFIESKSGSDRVNARSLLGVIYASTEYPNEMYLVNDTEDGEFPVFINSYRFLG